MLELREGHRYHHETDNPTLVSVGDVVIVHQKDHPRGFWKLGQIQQVLKGKDDNCRGAVVRVAHKGRQAQTLHRPIQLLYPLEISVENPGTQVDDHSTDDEPTPSRRPTRRAAVEARDRMLAQRINDNDSD